MPTLFNLLSKKFPEEFAKWDHGDYHVSSPISLDDFAEIEIQLINDDRSKQTVKIVIQ